MNARAAISAIDKAGILLVFPIANRREPPSLWHHFFPRSKMRWEWDEGGDDRVARLWHLREALSRSGKVVYAKWLQGRATFFSKDAFTAALAWINDGSPQSAVLSPSAAVVLDRLNEDSPRSLKALKRDLAVRKLDGPTVEKALKELWTRLLIVGFGEIDDGAFPSLAIGSTEALFEPLWKKAHRGDAERWRRRIDASPFRDGALGRALEKARRAAAFGSAAALPVEPPSERASGGRIRYEDLVKRGAGPL